MPAERPRNGARAYHASGVHTLTRTLPEIMARITDASVPDEALSPVEQAARAWRSDVLADLGGLEQVPTARLALLDAAVGSVIILHSLDSYLFGLAVQNGLVNRRSRRAFAIVEQRMRIADSLARQLQTLGLDRVPQKVTDLNAYVTEKYGGNASQDGQGDHEDANHRSRTPLPRDYQPLDSKHESTP